MILLMGLAGSGKGTQGKLLAEKLGYSYLSTGDFLRQYLPEQRMKEILGGKLIEDREMISIIERFLRETGHRNKTILDGFPRSVGQAEWLLEQNRRGEVDIEAVVFLEVPEEQLVKRLEERGRADDTREAIKVRFDEYRRATQPVIELCKQENIPLLEVDGTGKVQKIHQDIVERLAKPR